MTDASIWKDIPGFFALNKIGQFLPSMIDFCGMGSLTRRTHNVSYMLLDLVGRDLAVGLK